MSQCVSQVEAVEEGRARVMYIKGPPADPGVSQVEAVEEGRRRVMSIKGPPAVPGASPLVQVISWSCRIRDGRTRRTQRCGLGGGAF